MPGIPDWARAHLDRHLPGDLVLGGRAVSRNLVLAVTRRGAVLVRRGLLGGVTHVLAEVPQDGIAFRCAGCGHNLQFYGLTPPATVYCSVCAAKFHVDADGAVSDAAGKAVHAGPGAGPGAEAAGGTLPEVEPAHPAGAFTHGGYTLYKRDVATKSGARPLYFFSKGIPKSGEAAALPEGHEVGVNERTGLPFLRRTPGSAGGGAAPKRRPRTRT